MTFEVEEPMGGNFTVELRQDQWDLIVLALEQIRNMADSNSEATMSVDRLGRRFLRRCVVEIVSDIRANVPEHKA